MRPLRWLNIGTLLVTLMCGVSGCSGSSDLNAEEGNGGLAVTLTIGDGTVIDQVAWEIVGGDMPPMSGIVDTSAPGSTASVEVFGLPEGDFTVTLQATATDGETTCGGSAPFHVDAGEVTEAHVLLRCKLPPRLGSVRVNGELNVCAELIKAVVSPLQTSVGNDIDLMATAQDAEDDPIGYEWTALVGSIAAPSEPLTVYTCEAEGDDEITISVSDDGGESCMSSWTVPVTCVGGGGGTGGAGGAGGAGGVGGGGVGGSGGTGGMAGAGGTAGTGGTGGTCSNAIFLPISGTDMPVYTDTENGFTITAPVGNVTFSAFGVGCSAFESRTGFEANDRLIIEFTDAAASNVLLGLNPAGVAGNVVVALDDGPAGAPVPAAPGQVIELAPSGVTKVDVSVPDGDSARLYWQTLLFDSNCP